MKFDELNRKMRVFETSHDHYVLPEMYMVARLDGRGFTRLTKETLDFEVPYDEKFRDLMVETTKHLMECGIKFRYAYTESDEISLLFDIADQSFSRKLRKLNSVLAGEASAKFTHLGGTMACFDCRISQLPTQKLVVDYFRWRNEDAHRNALNSHCYWKLRKEGLSGQKADSKILGLTVAEKNELLFQYGINFNDLPLWQKRGIGLYWKEYLKEGFNPVKDEKVTTHRRKIYVQYHLPMRDDYDQFLIKLITENPDGST